MDRIRLACGVAISRVLHVVGRLRCFGLAGGFGEGCRGGGGILLHRIALLMVVYSVFALVGWLGLKA